MNVIAAFKFHNVKVISYIYVNVLIIYLSLELMWGGTPFAICRFICMYYMRVLCQDFFLLSF